MGKLIIDGKQIETPIKDIVESLQQQLFLMHIDRLVELEYKQNNIRCRCPFHSGGQERTPSCDILLSEDKDSTMAGTVHCFGCGYTASLVKFISDCLNISYRKAKMWLLGGVNYSLIENVRDIPELDIESQISPSNEYNWSVISEDELKRYDYIHPYMFERKLTDDIIEKFEVGYDPKTDAITFPVYVDGICRLVCKRKVKYKRFDMPKIEPKPIYGLDYVTADEIIVCESVINALTCWVYGKQAIALFGTGSEWQIQQLNKIPQRHIILALDGDEAGEKGTQKLIRKLTNKIVTILKVPKGKDINDLSKEEFDNLEEII